MLHMRERKKEREREREREKIRVFLKRATLISENSLDRIARDRMTVKITRSNQISHRAVRVIE